MADDLIHKYFNGELTEDEEKALSERLLNSTEDALRFGEEARKSYFLFGLPEPHWPGHPPPPGPGHSAPPTPPGPAAPPAQPLLHWAAHLGLKPLVLAGTLCATGAATVVVLEHRPPAALTATAPSLPTAVPAKKPVPLRAAVTPVDLAAHPHATHSRLAVVVHQEADGPLTVRVCGLDSQPLVLLYEGALKAGQWRFDWDGKTPEGALLSPGYYQVQIQSGPRTQKRIIQVR